MQIVTLDFETYFDSDYTLKKMTTEAYVRDPRFEVHGCAFKFYHDHPAKWVEWMLVDTVLAGIDWSQTAVLCHHAQFDGFILAHHYGIKPALWLDTLSMARALVGNHIKVGLDSLAKHFGLTAKTVPYDLFKGKHWHELDPSVQDMVARGACHDVNLTWDIFCKMALAFPPQEFTLCDATVRMFTEPVLVGQTSQLAAIVSQELKERQELLDSLETNKKVIGSDEMFAELLRAEGVEPEIKTTAKGNQKYAFAKTDQFMRDLKEDENPRVAALAEARLAQRSSILYTRAARLAAMSERGALCVYLSYCGAHTTRWSGGDKVNWQNFPRESTIGEAIEAPEGHSCVVSDASQIECRLLNRVAGQWDVIERFARHEDPYIGIASEFYREPVYKPAEGDSRYSEMEQKRGTGKQLELSCGYGAGGPTIQATAAKGTYGPPVFITAEDALRARDLYRSRHPAVVSLWQSAEVVLKRISYGEDFTWTTGGGFSSPVKNRKIYLPNGLFLNYESLEWNRELTDGDVYEGWSLKTRNGLVKMYGAKLIENFIQALSACHIRSVWLACQQHGMRFVNMEHDKLIAVEQDLDAGKWLRVLQQEMRRPPPWLPDIPLDSDGHVSKTYKRVK
jgi:DNA polymerase